MAEAVYSDLKTKLNTRLRDSANVTFTSAEKDEILREAINDPFVAGPTRDKSITLATGTYDYALPDGLDALYEMLIDKIGDGPGLTVTRNAWRLLDSRIYLDDAYKTLADTYTGKALILIGHRKYTEFDSFPDKVQDYILHRAMIAALEELTTSFSTRFLKNDVTMQQLLANIARHEQRAERLKASIANQYPVVI